MTFSVIAPPGDEQKLRDVGLEIVQAGKRLGFTLDPEGFLMAWVGESMRVLVDRDEKGEIIPAPWGFPALNIENEALRNYLFDSIDLSVIHYMSFFF